MQCVTIISVAQICTALRCMPDLSSTQAFTSPKIVIRSVSQCANVWCLFVCVCVCVCTNNTICLYFIRFYNKYNGYASETVRERERERMRKYLKYAQNDYIKFSRIDTVIFIAYGYLTMRAILYVQLFGCVWVRGSAR